MNEQASKEVANAARQLDMDIEDVEKKWQEIRELHGYTAEEWKLTLSLFRQWFSGINAYKDAPEQGGSGGSSLIKPAFGYFLSVDATRDMGAMQNDRIKKEYQDNPDQTYQLGRVAMVTKINEGYSISRMDKGEELTKTFDELPKNCHEMDVNEWIIPLDNMPSYGTRPNPNYGKPLPHEQYRMAGVFIGDVEGDDGLYYFSYKGEASKTFCPPTFNLLSMSVIRDENNPDRIYGFKNGTLDSLVYNSDLEDGNPAKKDTPSVTDFQNHTMEWAKDKHSPLVDLNRYHASAMGQRFAERFVITDGSVSSVNMTPNKFGTRRVTITDINADFDYEGGGWAGTTCWVPPHVDINFGIGSSIVLVGRTSQGRQNDDGSTNDATLNVSGLLVTENRGAIVEPFVGEAEEIDWF